MQHYLPPLHLHQLLFPCFQLLQPLLPWPLGGQFLALDAAEGGGRSGAPGQPSQRPRCSEGALWPPAASALELRQAGGSAFQQGTVIRWVHS